MLEDSWREHPACCGGGASLPHRGNYGSEQPRDRADRALGRAPGCTPQLSDRRPPARSDQDYKSVFTPPSKNLLAVNRTRQDVSRTCECIT